MESLNLIKNDPWLAPYKEAIEGRYQYVIDKEKSLRDERSYQLVLTPKGYMELGRNYQMLLRPYYYLKEQMGDDFDQMMEQIKRAGVLLQGYRDGQGEDNV